MQLLLKYLSDNALIPREGIVVGLWVGSARLRSGPHGEESREEVEVGRFGSSNPVGLVLRSKYPFPPNLFL